jgi:hypothetical protein
MEKYGINNVRGGSFVRIKLDESDQKVICKMINGATDRCFLCGKNDHFVANCPDKTTHDNVFTTFFENLLSKQTLDKISNIFTNIASIFDSNNNTNNDKCYRCKRIGHWANECYANDEEMVYCCEYCGKEFDTLKGTTYHENIYCKKKTSKSKNMCFRCGREGHYATKCYAKKHINGYTI